jgi:hypothetical protein
LSGAGFYGPELSGAGESEYSLPFQPLKAQRRTALGLESDG